MKRVSATIGMVPFSRVLADMAAEQARLGPAARVRGHERVYCHLALLPAGTVSHAPSAGAEGGYLDEGADGGRADKCAMMLEAARRFEAILGTSTALSPGELRRLRREAALSVHPDLFTGPDKLLAEELMKSVNIRVAAALDCRPN